MKNLLLLLLLAAGFNTEAQDFNYTHYNTKDGLAGMTVYDMCQDKDGFIWFATENGLSRFDGARFRNYTVKDGLPDNEVLKVFADSRGRVWLGVFNKKICYYYKGKIYDRTNNSNPLNMRSSVYSIAEDHLGNLYFSDNYGIMKLTPDGRLTEITGKRWKNIAIGGGYKTENIWFRLDDSLYRYVNNQLKFYSKYEDRHFLAKKVFIHTDIKGNVSVFRRPAPILSFSIDTATHLPAFYNSINGSWEYGNTGLDIISHFLPGKKVTRTIRDQEGNLWFATLGEGVYKLASKETLTFLSRPEKEKDNREVFAIARQNGQVFAGLNFGKMLAINGLKKATVLDYAAQQRFSGNYYENNRLYRLMSTASGALIMGFDAFLAKYENGRTTYNYIFPIKSVATVDREYIAAGTSAYVFKIRLKDLAITDTIWRERCTKVLYHQGKYYIGALDGVYEVNPDKSHRWLGVLHPTLASRVTDIQAGPDGALWIAGSDNGIVALKNGRITAVLKDTNGLTSNNCRALFVQNNFLWAGTSAGLNRIDIGKPAMPVIRYTVADGLPDNSINAVYVKDSIVWAGTPAGLTYFNENRISTSSMCRLLMERVTVSGRERPDTGVYRLPYRDNNITFSFTAVSMKAAGEIMYYYRLNGLHGDWRQKQEAELNYQSLGPGSYELELYAVNKFGVQSNTLIIQVHIDRPFWLAWWFYGLILIFSMGLLAFFLQRRNRGQRRRLEERNKTQQQFAALEQQALQAQMNPHFIFNCLNSIQQYILTNEKEKANLYLTGFASLVRQTLDHSGRKTVTVSEEAAYLRQYLEMEKMRFGDHFSYSISIAPGVRADFTEIPALLMQPFVENALRHGIRHKQDGPGMVTVRFEADNGSLLCEICDNGVGRQKAAEYKSRQHIEYQSKGMSLTAKRVELLNRVNSTNIEIDVADITSSNGQAAGTLVTIKIPV